MYITDLLAKNEFYLRALSERFSQREETVNTSKKQLQYNLKKLLRDNLT